MCWAGKASSVAIGTGCNTQFRFAVVLPFQYLFGTVLARDVQDRVGFIGPLLQLLDSLYRRHDE
jgi:hypothetical protein